MSEEEKILFSLLNLKLQLGTQLTGSKKLTFFCPKLALEKFYSAGQQKDCSECLAFIDMECAADSLCNKIRSMLAEIINDNPLILFCCDWNERHEYQAL